MASRKLESYDLDIGAPCELCGEPTNNVAGNPGLWSVRFPKPDGTGIARVHHMKCVMSRVYPNAGDRADG